MARKRLDGPTSRAITHTEMRRTAGSDLEVASGEFARLASRHHFSAIRQICASGVAPEVAADILQNILTNMWENREAAKRGYSNFQDWLNRSIRSGIMAEKAKMGRFGAPMPTNKPIEVDHYAYCHGDDEWTGDVSNWDTSPMPLPAPDDLGLNHMAKALHEILSQ